MLTTSFPGMRILPIILTSILIPTLSPTTTNGQAKTFTHKSVDYVIEFPSPRWQPLASSGIVPPRTRKEFIYRSRNTVRLLVRRKLVDADVTPSDMVRRRQLWDRHLAGYVLLKEDDFSGRLNGSKFSYEYVRGGKPMAALVYYLEADSRTIYSLLFRGPRDELQRLSNQTDSIARSFRLK
jgi:hypothetical protein